MTNSMNDITIKREFGFQGCEYLTTFKHYLLTFSNHYTVIGPGEEFESRKLSLRLLFPLFRQHPTISAVTGLDVNSQAIVYSLLWLIPINR